MRFGIDLPFSFLSFASVSMRCTPASCVHRCVHNFRGTKWNKVKRSETPASGLVNDGEGLKGGGETEVNRMKQC